MDFKYYLSGNGWNEWEITKIFSNNQTESVKTFKAKMVDYPDADHPDLAIMEQRAKRIYEYLKAKQTAELFLNTLLN